MSRFDLERIAVPGPSSYSASNFLRFDISGPGRVDLHKSSLLYPVAPVVTVATDDYLDSVVGTIEDMTLYANNQAFMTVPNYGLVLAAYVHKLKSAEWQNNEGVSRLGLDVKEYAVAGTDTDGTAIRQKSFDVTRRHNIPLSYFLPIKGGQLPCHNRLKWTVEFKLRSDAEATVAGAGITAGDAQITYKVNQPTLSLHRIVSDAEGSSFAGQFSSGVELDILYWSSLVKSASAAAYPVIDNTLNQRVDGQLMIQRLDSAISGGTAKLAQTMTSFVHNGLTDFHVQYPSGQRMPKSGDFDVTEAEGNYECWQALKDIKYDMEEYMDRSHDEYLGCGPSINGLIANADTDFMLAVRPQTREQGTATWNLSGTASAACKMYVFSMSKARLQVSASGVALII